jgi:hypothetical protein
MWGILSDERSNLQFTVSAAPRQRLTPEVEVEVKLRPKVNRPVCFCVGLPSGAHAIFLFCLTTARLSMLVTLFDERMGL